MYLIISLCCVNLVLVMPTPSVAVSPSVRVPGQDAGRNTSGKMVTWQQNWFDLRGAGELHTGCDQLGGGGELHTGRDQLGGAGELHLDLDQLGEAGSLGIVIPHCKNKVSFLSIKKWLIYQH